ncbi:hypothetical protein LARI1_G007782 [Lachnellula arida]|uniref:Uncharacterized protein n=1 Tax=Lachnellula arida TaxID=1316785 RepID=A0A8T9B2C0_9HELO|nr:hypothetical protein LARI1_G007782 [Lachnellula arida]
MPLPDISCLTNPTHKYNIHCFHPPPSLQPALPLFIPPYCQNSHHRLHLPSLDQPFRIQVEGPLIAIQKLLPKVSWHTPNHSPIFPLPGGPELAKLAFKTIYCREVDPDVPGDMVIRDEYKGWLREARPDVMIDYYGITFDHLVPIDDIDPEVLQINIMEIEDDGGIYANKYSRFRIDPADYTGKKVLALPRCCQTRKGTTDRRRVNEAVNTRDGRA